MRRILTSAQMLKLKEHEYRSEGCSIIEELFLKHFWSWLVEKLPLWLAPNLITFVGFIITVAGTLSVMLQDMNCEGKAPGWALVFCAVGIFIYQTLDGCDGKQARRTQSSNSLGELFDHGCDAIATFLYATAAACTPALIDYPYLLLGLVIMVMQMSYSYHWQTYVCRVLYFKRIDIAEAHYAQIIGLLITFFLGIEVWHHQTLSFLGIDVPLKVIFASGTMFFGIINLSSAYYIILTQGVGKNGSTTAGTSVVSPVVTLILIVGVALLYAVFSPVQMLHNHCILFLTAFTFPLTKAIISMMIAGMTESPYPLFDYIMIGPLLGLVNLYFVVLPEYYLLLLIALYNIYDIVMVCITLCWEVSETLGVSCFTIPYPPPPPKETGKTR